MGPVDTVEVSGKRFDVYTLPAYATPYFYVREFGSVHHFDTLPKLRSFIRKEMKRRRFYFYDGKEGV